MKLKLTILSIVLIALTIVNTTSAQVSTNTSCSPSQSDVLIVNISYAKYTNDTLTETRTQEFPIYCEHGCYDNECAPRPFMQNAFVLGLVAVFFIVFIIVVKARK